MMFFRVGAPTTSWASVKTQDSKNKMPMDIYAIGFQEVSSRLDRYLLDVFSSEDPWTKMVDLILNENGYKRVARIRLLGIVLCIYIHNR